jgi:hypothetical protein
MRYIGLLLLLCGSVVAGELSPDDPRFTMRDSSGKVVTWSISKPDCDVRDGTALVMSRFGLTTLKLLPMCGEKVTFFEDTGTFDGVKYVLRGAEYIGPWGTRCAYAVAETADGAACPRDVEVALHVLGSFRYCLWGGGWGARRTYEQEIASGEVIDGTATLARVAELMASGMPEARAQDEGKVYKKASLWMAGSVVKQIPLPTDAVALSLVSNSEGVFYATTRLTNVTAYAQIPVAVENRREYGPLCADSSTTVVDVDSVPDRIDGIKVTRVVIKQREATCSNTLLGNAPYGYKMTNVPYTRQIAKITTYPCY